MPTNVLCCRWYVPLVEGLLSLLSPLGKATSPQEVESLSPASEGPTCDIQLLNQQGKIRAKKTILNSVPNSAFWTGWSGLHKKPSLQYIQDHPFTINPWPSKIHKLIFLWPEMGNCKNHFIGINYLSNYEIIDLCTCDLQSTLTQLFTKNYIQSFFSLLF